MKELIKLQIDCEIGIVNNSQLEKKTNSNQIKKEKNSFTEQFFFRKTFYCDGSLNVAFKTSFSGTQLSCLLLSGFTCSKLD